MKVIYIASPYSIGNTEDNVRRQIEAAHRIMDYGHCPIAPNLTHYMHLHRKRPYEQWLEADFELIKRCDALIRLSGQSPGADREVCHAQDHRIPVFFCWTKLAEYLGVGQVKPASDQSQPVAG